MAAAAYVSPAAILGQDPDNFVELAQQDTQQLVNAHGAGSTVAYAAGDFNNLLQLNANSLEGFDFARDVQEVEPLMKIIMKNNYGLLAQGTKVVCLQLTLSDLDFDGMQSMLVRFDQPHQHYLRQWYDRGVLALVAKRCFAMRKSGLDFALERSSAERRHNYDMIRTKHTQICRALQAAAIPEAEKAAVSEHLAKTARNLLLEPRPTRPCLAWRCPHYGTMNCPQHST